MIISISQNGQYLYSDTKLNYDFLYLNHSYDGNFTYKVNDSVVKKLDNNNDCLRNAEYIMSIINGKTIRNIAGVNSSTAYSCGIPWLIGNNDKTTMESVIKVPQQCSNEKAIPQIGESFFICCIDKNGYFSTESPYHAAALIFSDNERLITLETFVDVPGYSFNEYSRSGDSCFHNVWANNDNFKGKSTKTVCIKLR